MNSSNHLTHWNGRALKTLNRDECIGAMQELWRLYHSAQASNNNLKHKSGKSIVETY